MLLYYDNVLLINIFWQWQSFGISFNIITSELSEIKFARLHWVKLTFQICIEWNKIIKSDIISDNNTPGRSCIFCIIYNLRPLTINKEMFHLSMCKNIIASDVGDTR